MRTLVFGALLLLAACANNLGGCPPLKHYTAEEQDELAAAIEPLPGESIIVRMMNDYIALRDACRIKG